jgi:hypothetical protein
VLVVRSGAAAALLAAVLSGCAATSPGASGSPPSAVSARADEPGLSCSEATRAARGALVRLGYGIESVQPAQPGRDGVVIGRQNAGYGAASADERPQAKVTIHCSDRGAELEAAADIGFLAELSFRHDFPAAVAAAARRRVVRPRATEAPPSGLHLSVEPLLADEAAGELGVPFSSAAVTVVRMRIDNRSDRAYLFQRARVQLVAESGRRVRPLPIEKVAAPLLPAAAARVRERLIGEGEIAPGASLSGLLYFPAAAYKRANVQMTDRASDEAEGFRVDF